MIRQLTFVFILVLVSTVGFAQQENQFTQFMYNQLYLNPGYAGARGIPYFTALYRNQWTGFKGAPVSKLLSFNSPLFGDRVGFGLTVSNHTQGLENKWDATMAYSYNIAITDESGVRFGLQGSFRYQGIDFSDPSVEIVDPGDQSILYDEQLNKYNGNFGVGIYANIKQTYFGVSVPHFFPSELGINPNNIPEIARTYSHFYLMAGTMVPLTRDIKFKPAILAKYVKNAPFDLDVNASLLFNETFTAGLSYRLGGDGAGDSVDLLALYQVNSVGIGIAYDISLSDIKQTSSGSFEVLLKYDFIKERSDMANPRFFF
jgi:type IX secretion system PorP/SprF family membrane protein